jgi:N-glycosidase YbiA
MAKQVLHFYKTSDPLTGFMTNFFVSPFQADGAEWKTIEHYFQAKKFGWPAAPEGAKSAVEAIRTAETASLAKTQAWAFGKDLLDPEWDSKRVEVMKQALRCKFLQHGDLRGRLLATGDAILVERSDKDGFWGDGPGRDGRNVLGELLMEVRGEMRLQAQS